MDCEGNFRDPWCFCFNSNNTSIPQYKQFDANYKDTSKGIGFHCCHLTHYDPSFIAQQSPSQGNINSALEYLSLIQTESTNDVCDYTVYTNQVSGDVEFKNEFPDLYETAETDRVLFNAFYNKDNSVHQGIVSNNNEILPTFTANNVSCPLSNYIPYYIAYETNDRAAEKYIFICYPEKASFPRLPITYKSLYFYDNNDNNCKNNSCTTKFGATTIGLNAGDQAHHNKRNTGLSTAAIIGISLGSILGLALIIVVIYYIIAKRKKN